MPEKVKREFGGRVDEIVERNSLNPITLLLGFLAAGVMGYIASKYWNSQYAYDAALARYALMLAIFAVAGLGMADLLDNNASIKFRIVPLTPDYVGKLLSRTLLTLIIGIGAEIAITYIVTLQEITPVYSAVAREDLAAYYLFAGPAENLFYQGVILNLIAKMINNKYGKGAAVVISAAAFALSHMEVYGNTPYLLVIQFVLGVLWGTAYVYWKDITPGILGHLIKNAIAAGQMLVY